MNLGNNYTLSRLQREKCKKSYEIINMKDAYEYEFAMCINNVFIIGTGISSKPWVYLPKDHGFVRKLLMILTVMNDSSMSLCSTVKGGGGALHIEASAWVIDGKSTAKQIRDKITAELNCPRKMPLV